MCFLRGTTQGQLTGRCVAGNGGAGTDSSAILHFNRCHQLGIGTDKYAVADNGAVLVGTIVIAGDGTRTDVHISPDSGVTNVAEMIDLGAFTHI